MVRFIDLFAGIGGIRKGFEEAFKENGMQTKCVLTSEIKESAIQVLKANHPDEPIFGDIREIESEQIPDFDFLLAGFPCQAFSPAGKRLGFLDTRGTLFFEVERILRDKRPYGFILENVEGLVNHDKKNKNDKIGRTLSTILHKLKELDYEISWKVLNAKDFGVPQERKRIYIIGTLGTKISLANFPHKEAVIADILEYNAPVSHNYLAKLLLEKYSLSELYGKSIKDKRGGTNNIHSWDIDLKGKITIEQKNLLNQIFKERRRKKWAEEIGIEWMDGMPLTKKQISTFFDSPHLKLSLDDLVKKGYLKLEHPKRLIEEKTPLGIKRHREQDPKLPLGYNIVAGKLSFEINKILDPCGISPTLVAMDMKKLYVVDGTGLRTLSLREGLRLCGYPDDYKFPIGPEKGYDLLGNTVVVPVIQSIAERLVVAYQLHLPVNHI